MKKLSGIVSISVGSIVLLFFILSFFSSKTSYSKQIVNATSTANKVSIVPEKKVEHLKTPEPLKGIYMTQCVASLPSFREKLVKLIGETELNAVVIDIKDYSGTVSFKTGNSEIDNLNKSATGCKVSDMPDLIAELHSKNIYVIGRVTVFQDPLYVKAHPDLAVKKKSDGGIWKDKKGISYVDVGAKPFWNYITAIATSSYAIGFDEINFDYIRFASDGSLGNISFPYWDGKTPIATIIANYFKFLRQTFPNNRISADLFGLATVNNDDLGIGQIIQSAYEYFDYVCPMVYPSHYAAGFIGYKNPADYPYQVISYSLENGLAKLLAMKNTN